MLPISIVKGLKLRSGGRWANMDIFVENPGACDFLEGNDSATPQLSR